MGFKAMIQMRDEALLSLDEKKIRAYSRKYGVAMPSEPLAFWAGIHKARCQVKTFSEEAKDVSRRWLDAHGMTYGEPASRAS